MRCDEVLELLTAFSAGELPVDVRRAMQAHLGDCAGCRAAVARADVLAGVLAGVPAPPLPEGLASRIVASARQRHEAMPVPPGRLLPWWRPTSAPMRAAAAIAAFAFGIWGASELSQPSAANAGEDNVQPAAESILRDWFEAAPEDSLASRYLVAIKAEED
jgi:anti-sigma factor RsiW